MREALDEAEADRIVGRNENNRNLSGSLPHRIQYANRAEPSLSNVRFQGEADVG